MVQKTFYLIELLKKHGKKIKHIYYDFSKIIIEGTVQRDSRRNKYQIMISAVLVLFCISL